MTGLNEGEACLGWKLYVPYGSRAQQYEYYGIARMALLECGDLDNVIDREHGCYGLPIGKRRGNDFFFLPK